MSRDTRLAFWPEQTGYLPLLSPWADIKNMRALDLSACLRVDSCGLAGGVLKVHHALASEEERLAARDGEQCRLPLGEYNSVKIEKLYVNPQSSLAEQCNRLNFFTHIRDRFVEKIQHEYENHIYTEPVQIEAYGEAKLSFPVIRVAFTESPDDRRAPLENFIYTLEKYFDDIPKSYSFRKTQLITTLYEIVKNTADHTSSDAYMGCDFIYSRDSARLNIVVGDLGPGIYVHLKPYIERTLPQRKGKLGLAEVYKWALEDGNSSKVDSGKNMGFGMSFINGHCRALNATLSVFDVKSRGVLSSIMPVSKKSEAAAHNAVWRCFQRVDGVKPFFYYIEVGV